MLETTLQRNVDALFCVALQQTTALPELYKELSRCQQRLRAPMRVAVVGKIKAGKSTFTNALLGEKIAEMGAVETTFNINWLSYGKERTLTVFYKDANSQPETLPYTRLAELTKRSEEPSVQAYLRSIKHIRITSPNEILHTFDLIDTPGLESTYQDDAQNTRDFLVQHGKELTEITSAEAAQADAVLYLFAKGIAESDDTMLQEFQGDVMKQARPFNAIGVLTKVDTNWRAYDDPVQGTLAITHRLASSQQVRKQFYAILPVAGLLGLGAQMLTAAEFATLQQLAALPSEQFKRMTMSEERFKKGRADVAIPAAQLQQVAARLQLYGIHLACKLINEQHIHDRQQLTDALYARSGLPELRQLILSHFGNRAYLIKLSSALNQLETTLMQARQEARGATRELIADLAGKFQMIREQEHVFQEIEALSLYYEGKLAFTIAEGRELLQVTGEDGSALYQRLGLPKDSTQAEMQWFAEQRLWYWKKKASDFGFDRTTLKVAAIIMHSYNQLVYEIMC